MSKFTTAFKNVGHAFAKTAKYIAIGIKDVVTFANKAQAVEPALELLIGALAGPQSAKVTDLAFHALGDVAAAVDKLGPDFEALSATNGLNVQLDAQTVQDIKAVIPVIKGILAALGSEVPKQ